MICQTISRRWIYFCLIVFFTLSAGRGFGATVIAPSFDQLVESADLIFTGQTRSQRSEWRNIGGQKSIVTLVSFRVSAVHKGRADSVVTLQFLGGAVGDVTLDVSDMPKFRKGERVVLFVQKNGANASPLIGFYHGKFSLQSDATGRETVWKHDGEAVMDVLEIGRSKPTARSARVPLSNEEFTGKVREHLSRSRE
ncbi:MAG TPA: hypothetical protein VK846_13945 [Candidatus Limnocylindria bacterium]|nr:hypothetical protein [Candidatus Limnocylindria bacterium]